MDPLTTPTAAPPVMFGAPARRAVAVVVGPAAAGDGPHLLDRHHSPGRPSALSTGLGVWLAGGFWFSTGSLARHNLAGNPQITVHLDSGTEVVIVEGVAAAVTGAERLRDFLAAYNTKYDWDAVAIDQGVVDSSGAAGPAYRVRPQVVFGWGTDLRTATGVPARGSGEFGRRMAYRRRIGAWCAPVTVTRGTSLIRFPNGTVRRP